ncbi:MAG: ABC-2 transporter permease [Thermoleophilia bacterium]
MWQLIAKDLSFNKKQVLIGILITLVIALVLRDERYSVSVFFLGSSFIFNQVVGKSCYMDDKGNAFAFLKSLPISKKAIVLSKYAEGLMSLAVALVIISAVNIVLALTGASQVHLGPVALILIMLSALLIYFGVYLLLFFRYGFAAAQHSMVVIIIMAFIAVRLQSYLLTSTNTSVTSLFNMYSSYVVLAAAVLLFTLSGKLSVNIFSSREISVGRFKATGRKDILSLFFLYLRSSVNKIKRSKHGTYRD